MVYHVPLGSIRLRELRLSLHSFYLIFPDRHSVLQSFKDVKMPSLFFYKSIFDISSISFTKAHLICFVVVLGSQALLGASELLGTLLFLIILAIVSNFV